MSSPLPRFITASVYILLVWTTYELAATQRPNIIVIMADDLGYNDVSYHGSEIATPNLDLLAVTGVRLENYYTASRGAPSRTQFFSGGYSQLIMSVHTMHYSRTYYGNLHYVYITLLIL